MLHVIPHDYVMQRITTNMATSLSQIFYHSLSRNATCKTLTMFRCYSFFKHTGRMLCTRATSMKVKDCYLLLGVDWSAKRCGCPRSVLEIGKAVSPGLWKKKQLMPPDLRG
ncbi:hypothetical protein OS493_009537 [Desmophyllum pertusum]|uniref:Uncharacterized protein n=1 Tax=Desmophyllum pertusum TaxID=174260 RepID=A0A9X0CLJ7_9CNID|nr:hypothetical protein OS493_009537 [Desmophyllum pertusum]